MLPLDKLTEEAKIGFSDHGVTEDDIIIALQLDLDLEGNFGETWLAVDIIKSKMYSMSITSDADTVFRQKKAKDTGKVNQELFKKAKFEEYDLGRMSIMYVDNFTSSNRMLTKLDVTEENSGTTLIIAYSTNARKKKLFAFIDLVERLKNGDSINENDPIFEQFNQKCPKCGKIYKDQNRRICENCMNKKAVVRRLLKYFTEFKLQLIVVLFCMVSSSVISLISPIINGKIFYDQVIYKPGIVNGKEVGTLHTVGWVYALICILFGISIISLLIGIVQSRANARMSTRVTLNMKMDIFSAMQKLSLSFFNNNQTGRLIVRVNNDAENIRSFFINGVPSLIISSINFIGLTVFLFILNWKLTLIVFVPVPIVFCLFKFMLPKLWRMYSMSWRRSSSLNAVLGDSLTGIRVVKAFAKEAEETNRFYTYAEKLFKTNLQLNLVSITIFPVIGLLIGISSNAIWGFGGIDVMHEVMTYGEFTTYFGYLGMIFGPLNFFSDFTNLITQTTNSAQRMFEIIDAIPEITDAPDAVKIDRFKGDIEFKKVCFHYTPNRPILKNVSFKIHTGDHIGLVGHTGAGKSTIANLINRLYDVISGSIEIDGVNVKNIAGESMRKNIAIVSQEIYLFKGTIADNIRYGRPDATMEDVITASRAANAHDFILNLPHGYETIVGTGSRSLSGGEQQRISIARALLLGPTILILDEATAAMDTETERLIQDALNLLIQGRTTITIAHRLSTLKECNYLFALEDGEIAEEGTHVELIAKKGIYFRLYTLQNEAMRKVIQGM
jgi:ATP-binding cassette subfamily B protein